MIFEPFYIRWLKGCAVAVVILGAYLWVSVDDGEFEQESTPYVQPLPTTAPEPEPELPEYAEPEHANFGWIVPPEPIRKSVARVKRKVKRAVQK